MQRSDSEAPRYRQVVLSAEELEYGLTRRPDRPPPPDHWEPIPWEPIAVLLAEPDALEPRFGIVFQDTFDQLDYLRLALLDLTPGLRVAFVRHRGMQVPGTSVYILPQQLVGAEALRQDLDRALDSIQDDALRQIMDDLALRPEDFSWTRARVRTRPLDEQI
jgi:hypothetical protein